jgi:nucleotide-binding universal stress UspA family protein
VTEALRFRTILVPIDFSESSHRALDVARALAKSAGPAHLILVHAYFVPVELEALAERAHEPILEVVSKQASEDLEQILVKLQDEAISAEFGAYHGSPDQVIVNVANEKGADLIIMGTTGRTGVAHMLLGSVAARVVRGARCPVITVKAKTRK